MDKTIDNGTHSRIIYIKLMTRTIILKLPTTSSITKILIIDSEFAVDEVVDDLLPQLLSFLSDSVLLCLHLGYDSAIKSN